MFLVALTGCAAKPTAAGVCAKLEGAGVAAACKANAPTAIDARATNETVFDLVGVKGETGHVLAFASAEDYDATLKAYDATAMLAGAHRYGSAKARIFVHLHADASRSDGDKAKSIVDAL